MHSVSSNEIINIYLQVLVTNNNATVTKMLMRCSWGLLLEAKAMVANAIVATVRGSERRDD